MTVKATEAIYRTANKESLAQILAIISVDKNGKVNPSLKNATVQNSDQAIVGLLVRPVFNSPKTESTEDTEQDEIELPE